MSSSQDEVNTLYLQMFIADGQETSYVDDWEEIKTTEELKEWEEQWRPTLSEGEIEDISWALGEIVDEVNPHENVEKIRDIAKKHVKDFKKYLEEMWGESLGYESASDADLEESQF